MTVFFATTISGTVTHRPILIFCRVQIHVTELVKKLKEQIYATAVCLGIGLLRAYKYSLKVFDNIILCYCNTIFNLFSYSYWRRLQ